MNRRSFLQLLSTGALGAATLDVDKLLWTASNPYDVTVAMTFAPYELDDFRARYILPAVQRLADDVDAHFLRLYQETVH